MENGGSSKSYCGGIKGIFPRNNQLQQIVSVCLQNNTIYLCAFLYFLFVNSYRLRRIYKKNPGRIFESDSIVESCGPYHKGLYLEVNYLSS